MTKALFHVVLLGLVGCVTGCNTTQENTQPPEPTPWRQIYVQNPNAELAIP